MNTSHKSQTANSSIGNLINRCAMAYDYLLGKQIKHILPYIAFILFTVTPSLSMANGMDWKSAKVSATGIGLAPDRIKKKVQARAMACRAAKVDGLRNLLEVVQGVRVDSSTLVKDAMVESDLIRTTVKGIVKGAREVRRNHMADGSCEVLLEMPMAGELFSAVISEDDFHQRTSNIKPLALDFSVRMKQLADLFIANGFVTTAYASNIPKVMLESQSQLELAHKLQAIFEEQGDKVASLLMRKAIEDFQTARNVTGIVIDASGVLAFHPAALPWIRDNKGKKLYPNADTPYEVIRSSMPVSYDFNVESAVKNKRVATTPIVLKAVSTYKKRNSDLMLDEEGKKAFLSLIQKGNVNEKARIMIVVSD